jgi:hypothetical protein
MLLADHPLDAARQAVEAGLRVAPADRMSQALLRAIDAVRGGKAPPRVCRP